MKRIYACLFGLCGAIVMSLMGTASAERLPIGIGVSERYGAQQDWFEKNRLIHKVVDNSMPPDGYGGRGDVYPHPAIPSQRREAESSGNNMNDDINLPDSGVSRSMTPSADVPKSVHGGGPNPLPTFPDARPGPEGDPAVRDLGSSGLSAPSAPPGSLGR
ncbi:MAG: hypothetical protein AB7P24_20390 [Nitrospira sp.]